jgi:polyisoprenoid-binding protein YceI
MRSTFAVALLSLSLAFPGLASAADWTIDGAHTAVDFKVRHMMVSWVRGSFRKVSGSVQLDHSDLSASSVQVTIDASSVDTGNAKRDKHLRDTDFFDVAKYPSITFKSSSVRKVGGDSFEFVGDLTMLGTTREVVMLVTEVAAPIQTSRGGTKTGASASFEIKRSDFGMQYSRLMEAGGLVVGDIVKLSIDVELNGAGK